MATILLVRHCAALGQEPQAPLSAQGRAQALLLAESLTNSGVGRIVSSPYVRAVESARPLAERLGIEVELHEGLVERSLGHVEDGDWLSALRLSFEEPLLALPSGESSAQAQSRGRSVVDQILAADGPPTAIFSHGNLLSLIANSFDKSLGFEFWRSLSNPDVWSIRVQESHVDLERLWR